MKKKKVLEKNAKNCNEQFLTHCIIRDLSVF